MAHWGPAGKPFWARAQTATSATARSRRCSISWLSSTTPRSWRSSPPKGGRCRPTSRGSSRSTCGAGASSTVFCGSGARRATRSAWWPSAAHARAQVTPAQRGQRASLPSEKEPRTEAERRGAMTWAQRLRRVCMRYLPVPHPCRGSLRLCDSAILPNRPDRPRDLQRVRWGGAGDCEHRGPGGDRRDPRAPERELPAERPRAAARAAGTAGAGGLTARERRSHKGVKPGGCWPGQAAGRGPFACRREKDPGRARDWA